MAKSKSLARQLPQLPPPPTEPATRRENPSKPGIQAPPPIVGGNSAFEEDRTPFVASTPPNPNAYADAEVLSNIRRPINGVYMPDEQRLKANRRKWQHTLYGKFLGPRVQIHYLRRRLASMWPVQSPYFVGDLANRFYVFKFTNETDMIAILLGGPWIIQDHLLSLQRWRDNFDPSTSTFEITPVWIRFPNLPLDFWDGLTLTDIAACAGTPIRVETTVEDVGRCRYARALVEVDLWQPLCPGIYIGENQRWQKFTYERTPTICQRCGRITHDTTRC
ncbi:hypothetical protein QJS10_CPB20g00846 [Acorus calamus]|uniref:DUF4283 domain-containing protein n=1 Tax=Acorus calamus TaxID=4465 RepID=A0AAV9C9S0_ACOCL|nr:hypothetical protein QJS10_CPB20g00846 [Acorus calamus]